MDMDVKEEGMLNESRNDLYINCINSCKFEK